MESELNFDRPWFQTALSLVLMTSGLAACGVFKSNEEAQAIINRRVVGMPAGEFFQTFGVARNRSEQLDGTITYDWTSSIGAAAAGPNGLDERTCTLRIVADRRGRVATAEVVLDNPGRFSTSRCGEMFKAK